MKYTALATLILLGPIVNEARAGDGSTGVAPSSTDIPRAVSVARTTDIPSCSVFVDAASAGGDDGSAQKPHKTIAAAAEAAKEGAVICVAEGTYAEQLKPGEKGFTLAGGFQSGKNFKVRDSAAFVSKAQGSGDGSFLKIVDPGPKGSQLTAIDGFEITGYSQAILREHWEAQRFDVTNNFIHDNTCTDEKIWGGGFALNNVTGAIRGNVIQNNKCGRGGAGFTNDETKNTLTIENNLVDGNSGIEPTSSHGGGLNLVGYKLIITGNLFTNNSVTQWGGGLYIGAYTPGNQPTTATLRYNVYRGNKAGDAGGGFFCDDGAMCIASHELYEKNCGGNVLVDGAFTGSGPTVSTFDHITSIGALSPQCDAPGPGFSVDNYEVIAPDSHTITNSIFWGNADGADFGTACTAGCKDLKMSVTNSLVQTKYADGSIKITFGAGIVPPSDPQFVDPGKSDYRLKAGSPAKGKASDGSDLGAYGAGSGAPPPVSAALPTPAPMPVEVAPAKDVPAKTTTPALVSDDVSAKEAFDAAKELGTADGWNAFLESYPTGFRSDMARAYIKKLDSAEK